mgnify:FL=1
MDKSFNKNALVITIEVIAIVLGVVGITYAASTLSSSVNVSASNLNVVYTGSKTITATNLEPRVNAPTVSETSNVARVAFTVKGASANVNSNIIYDIMLDSINADSAFFNSYVKWRLYKNNSLLSEGNMSYSFDNNLRSNKLTLTNIQQDMPSNSSTADSYLFLMWIEETCTDVLNCGSAANQNGLIGKSFQANIFVAVNTGNKVALTRVSG